MSRTHGAQQYRLSEHERGLIARDTQLVRKITRDSIGLLISSILAIILPWQLFSAGLNATLLRRHVKQLVLVQDELKARGIKVRKRTIIKAIGQGIAVKVATTALLLGHDDLVGAGSVVDHWLSFEAAGQYIANDPDTVFHEPAIQQALDYDANHRANLPLVGLASSAASAPTEWVQGAMHLQTAGDVAQTHMSGWHAGAPQLAAQMVVAGGVQVATEKVIDSALEQPMDAMMDRKGSRIPPQGTAMNSHRPSHTGYGYTYGSTGF